VHRLSFSLLHWICWATPVFVSATEVRGEKIMKNEWRKKKGRPEGRRKLLKTVKGIQELYCAKSPVAWFLDLLNSSLCDTFLWRGDFVFTFSLSPSLSLFRLTLYIHIVSISTPGTFYLALVSSYTPVTPFPPPLSYESSGLLCLVNSASRPGEWCLVRNHTGSCRSVLRPDEYRHLSCNKDSIAHNAAKEGSNGIFLHFLYTTKQERAPRSRYQSNINWSALGRRKPSPKVLETSQWRTKSFRICGYGWW